jgi:hypothetical protein
MLNDMNTRYVKTDWLVPLVGMTVVAAVIVAGKTYFGFEQQAEAADAISARFERMSQNHQLSVVLKAIHDGEVQAAAQRLDLLLCGGILRINDELATADTETRAYVEDAFRRIAVVRPKIEPGGVTGSGRASGTDQMAAERILAKALATTHTAQAR